VVQCGAVARVIQGPDLNAEQLARDAYLESGIGNAFLGTARTMRHFRAANFDAELCDLNSFEQWRDEGAQDMQQRAHIIYIKMLTAYQMPPLDESIDEALLDFIAGRKLSMDDRWY